MDVPLTKALKIFKKMAVTVDKQNVDDKNYEPMSKNYDNSIAFKTACELALKGKDQPSGYTEPILHNMRQKKKSISYMPWFFI